MKSKLKPSRNKKNLAKKARKGNTFHFVAIGASAGGLEAVSHLLQNLNPDTGMAFFYVQHLSPDHPSALASLLSQETKMKVHEATNMQRIQPNNLYVCTPNKEMVLTDGKIKLNPRNESQLPYLPIDDFFFSVASKHKENAIGIILSGNATDGTHGLKAINNAGGLTFAQDESAKYSSMPTSAIAGGAVDFILSPKEIAREINRMSKKGYVKSAPAKQVKKDVREDDDFKDIFGILHKRKGVDFSHYQMGTIKRRLQHRMLQDNVKSLKEYAKLLINNSKEVDLLYKDLLINVTSFFREAETFRYLKTTLFPQLISKKAVGETLRIWVPACSTGEEAYSIGMVIMEILEHKMGKIPVQIFASDISEQAVSSARIGEYSKSDVEAIGKQRRERFFVKAGGSYRVVKELREMCVFAPHNILRDPPFSRMDFISCCNLLIYFDGAAQKKTLASFHFALNDGGYLVLGKSETTGTSSQLFKQLPIKLKIYSRKKNEGLRKVPELTPRFPHTPFHEKILSTPFSKKNIVVNSTELDNAIDDVLLSRYMPASAVINKDMEILQFRGSTSLYLTHSSGKASLNILKMIRPEFAFELRNAIHKSLKSKKPVVKPGIEIKLDSTYRTVSLEVSPLKIEWDEPLLLIVFTMQQQTEKYPLNIKTGKNNSTYKDRLIKKLTAEVEVTRDEMHSFIESQEAANEELEAANEEIISSNEEFQTLNEDLETSKEEIEATNEELLSTNRELQLRNDLLAESYNFSEAIIATMHEPIVILDKDLAIKSANKAFYKKFGVSKEETEEISLFELGNKQWNIPRLHQLLENILFKNIHFNDFEVTGTFPQIGERVMLLNASRIIQKTHHEQLILLAFEDITELANRRLREKEILKEDIRVREAQNEMLEKAVQNRTKEIEQARKSLEQKNIELEKMNKEISSFAYISSHDLQEPLRNLQIISSRILEKEEQNLSETGKEYFRRLMESAKRMQTLITDLLTYTYTNITERKFEKTDLNVVLEQVKEELKETIEEKHAVIKADKLSKIDIIPFQFRKLFQNLISNSLKFSRADEPPKIIIKSEIVEGTKLKEPSLSPQDKYYHISFVDNGIGFEPHFNDRIFGIFQRLHGKEDYEGTGIGLAICKKIVENHNGVITASGELNKGAVFDIYLPLNGQK